MSIIKKIRKESSVFVPNVLDKVMDRVGYLPTPKHPFWNMKKISILSMSAAMTIAAAIVVPYYVNKAVVADASTTVELTITPASASMMGTDIVAPVFVFQVDKLFITKAIDSDGTNAVYAKNENARIILAGVGRQNTTSKPADEVAVAIIDKAANAGYIELAGKGNVVTVAAVGKNETYCAALEENIYTDVMAYFRDRMIYGVVTVDDTTTHADFTGYDEQTDEADTEHDEENYETSSSDHCNDDHNRDSGWDSGYDSWMTEHDNHGHDDHNNHGSESSSSSESMGNSHHSK
ncbi:MAG: hypothetical protein NTV44_06485 [Firmicutes bacterium]|nr:hypothetical protein [Bacillota bacterium]